MRLPKFRVWTLMIAVAILAIALGFWRSLHYSGLAVSAAKRERAAIIMEAQERIAAAYFRSMIGRPRRHNDITWESSARYADTLAAEARAQAAREASSRRKYERAAFLPFLPVWSDAPPRSRK